MSERSLTIIARFLVKPEKLELVKSSLLSIIEPTRAEEGCIQYDLHQDNENPNIFLFFELWENRELWQNHINNTHIKEHQARTEGCLEEFVLNEMSQLG